MHRKETLDSIREKARTALQEQTDLLLRLCAVDSESNYEAGNRLVVDMVREVLDAIPGIAMEEIAVPGTGVHLIARIRPAHPQGKILLNAHLDTVFPVGYAAQYPPYVDEEQWLHGLGSGDCKAGVAVSAYAVRIAAELGMLPNKEIVLLYTCDEEIGSPTGRFVYQQEAAGAECAFVFESAIETENGFGIVTQRDGVILGSLDVQGVEAHAGGAYLQGHSAVKELAHKILQYYAFNDYEREIFYNVAPIRGGRPNGIVAGDAHMEFCVAGLPTNDSFAEAEQNIESLAKANVDPACRTTVEHHVLFPALERNEKSRKAFTLAREAGRLLGIELEETADPTATDANWFCKFGVPAIDALGPVQRGMHTTEEALYLPSLPGKTALFAVMLGLMQQEAPSDTWLE